MGCSTYSIAVSSRKSSDFVDETHLAAVLIAPPIFQAREDGAWAPPSLFNFFTGSKKSPWRRIASNDSSWPVHQGAHWRQPASDAPARR